MRGLVLLFPALLSACVATGGTDAITAALVGRSVDYSYAWDRLSEDREIQTWTADGRTEISNYYNIFTHNVSGRWKVENGRYCEIFGNNPTWTCLRVTFLDGGLVRFREFPADLGEMIVPLWVKDRTGKFLPD